MNEKISRKGAIWIFCLICAGTVLRALFLGRQSLWFDEAYTYMLVSQDFSKAVSAEMNNPPLYSIFLYFWTKVAGYSESGLRSFSVLCSGISLILLVPLLRQFLSERALLITLGIAAASPFHIYFAQEARCFALLNCWLLSMTCFAVRYGRDPRWKFALAYMCLAVVGLYTHFITVFYVAVSFFLMLWLQPRRMRYVLRLVGAHVAIVAAFTPWLITMLRAAGDGGQIRKYLLLKLPQTYVSFLYGDTLFPLSRDTLADTGAFFQAYGIELALAAVFSLLLAGYVLRFLLQGGARTALIPLVYGVAPVLIVFFISFKLMMLDERYVQFSSFFVYALIGAAVAQYRSSRIVQCALAGFFALQLVSVYNYYFVPSFGKEQWREVVSYTEQQMSSADTVLFDVGYLDIAFSYYQKKPVTTVRAVQNYVDPVEAPFEWESQIFDLQKVLLIRSHVENDAVLDRLRTEFQIAEQRYFPNGRGISVYRLEKLDGETSDGNVSRG